MITWRYLVSPRFILTQRIAADGNAFRNVNRDGVELHRGRRSDVMYRADWTYSRSPRLTFEGGGDVRRSRNRASSRVSSCSPGVRAARKLQRVSVRRIVLRARAHRQRAGHLRAGSRVDHSTLTGHTSASPWIETRWPLLRVLIARAGGGIYRQEPEFAEVKGLRGSNLDACGRTTPTSAVEGPLARSMTWQVSAYNREDRAYPWLPDAEFRVENGRLVLPSFTTRYENALDGHSRGVELVVQRRSPNGLSGWVAYNLAFTEYRNTDTAARPSTPTTTSGTR